MPIFGASSRLPCTNRSIDFAAAMQARTRSINQATAMKLNSILILPGIFMIAIMGIFPAAAQPVKVEYREETELVAVVARLAGGSGYTWEEEETGVYDYFIDVDSTFAPFRNHKLIPFVREKLYGEGFNWHFPMHIAMRIAIGEDGKITYDNSLEKEFDGYYDRITRRNEKKFLMIKDVIGVLEDRENNPEKYPAVADLMSEYSRVVNSFGKQE